MRLLATILVCLLGMASMGEAGTINRPAKSFGGNSFTNGVVPQASDFNGDVDTIYSEFNGNIENINIKAGAAIAGSKVAPDFVADVTNTSAAPCNQLIESDQAADAKRWDTCVIGGTWSLATKTDAAVIQNTWLSINRTNGGITAGGTSGTNTISGATTFNQAVTFGSGTNLLPTGTVQMYVGTSAPTGWLLLDGASNSCTTNAALCTQLVGLVSTVNYKGTASTTVTVDTTTNEILHTAHGHSVNDRVHFSTTTTLPAPLTNSTVYCIISTTADRYIVSTTCGGAAVDITTVGTGTHSDYFNFIVPDMRGRTPLGTGAGSGLTNRTLGSSGGQENVTLTAAQSGLPDHTHGNGATITNGAAGGGPGGFATGSNTTGVNGGAQNAGSAHNVMDPFIVLTFIIKT